MRIPKSVSLSCALALCLSGWAVRAVDTEAQAKARAALREKLAAPDAADRAPVFPPENAEAVAKARGALRQKMDELNAADWAPVFPPENAEAVAKAREALHERMAREGAVTVVTPTPPKEVAPPVSPAPPTRPPQPVAERPAPKPTEVKPYRKGALTPPGFKPLESPPSPLSAGKEARLAELLEQYKADKITPEEYHAKRAAILAEP
jgi:hypothetical protein